MFRKILAATTTALVAGALTLGAAAGPAFADGSGSPATDDSSTQSSTGQTSTGQTPTDATTDPDQSGDTATPPPSTAGTPSQSDATPTTPPAPTDSSSRRTFASQQPSLSCLPNSAVSYTYDSVHNSGVITITNPDPTKFTDQLCQGFYVTAVAWTYVTSGTWPQNLAGYTAANHGQKIDAVGTYEFGQAVSCGQGDIYASTQPLPTPVGPLTNEHQGYPESFLADLGFSGPTPTYMVSDPSCHVLDLHVVVPTVNVNKACGAPGSITWTDVPGKVTYQLTLGNGTTGYNEVTATAHGDWIFEDNLQTFTFGFDLGQVEDCGVTPGDPTTSPAVCTNGVVGNGTVTVGTEPGLDYTVTRLDGTPVPLSGATTSVPAGTYVVHVSAAMGYALQNQGKWSVAGPNEWTLEIQVGSPVNCDLPTDADFSIEWTSTNVPCTSGLGTVTVGPAEFAGYVNFFLDGKPVTPGTPIPAAAGAHIVTATAVNPSDTVDNSPQTATVRAADTNCPTQLKTLALTGTDANGPLVAAGVLLPAGAVLLLGAALIRRRREQ